METEELLPKVAGSPRPIEYKGKTYLLSQVIQNDIGAIVDWVRFAPRRRCKNALTEYGEHIGAEERMKLIEHAELECELMALDSSTAITEALATFDGTAFIWWLCLRKNHPELTMTEARELVLGYGVQEAQKEFEEANSLDEEAVKNSSAPQQRGDESGSDSRKSSGESGGQRYST